MHAGVSECRFGRMRRRLIVPLGLVAILGAAGLAAHRLSLRRHRGLLDTRPGLGPDGIVAGAGPLELALPVGAPESRAALLLHGFGDTAQSVGYLAGYLQGSGWAVRAPLLPGHGRTLRGFAASGAEQWMAHARAELRTLRERYERVVVVGQSMGGAIAIVLAAEAPAPHAVVLVAPYLAMSPAVERLARLSYLWSPLLPFIDSGGAASILDETERALSLAYGAVSGPLLAELLLVVQRAQAAAPAVRAPLLFVQSRRDHRVAAAACERAFAAIGSSRKRLVWLDDGGHVLTVDHGRERLFALIAAWLDTELARLPAGEQGV